MHNFVRSLLLVLVILTTTHVNAGVISSFDDGTLQGWVRANDGKNATITNPGSGGNAGGYMLFTDGSIGGPPENVVAPQEFLGDWSMALSNPDISTISLDAQLFDPVIPGGDDIIISISGPGGTANINLGLPNAVGTWEHLSTPIREPDWTITSGSWSALLSDVTSLEVQMDWTNPAGSQNGLDNFRLNVVPVNVVPEPSSCITLSLGALLFVTTRRRTKRSSRGVGVY